MTPDFPVLSAGPTPHTPLEERDFTIVGEVDEPRRWTWEEFRALPSDEVTVDIHCVTKWSKLDTVWKGISVDALLDGIDTSAEYVIEYSDVGYTKTARFSAGGRIRSDRHSNGRTRARSRDATRVKRPFASTVSRCRCRVLAESRHAPSENRCDDVPGDRP